MQPKKPGTARMRMQELMRLVLLDEFVYDLCACAANPTQTKISAFHSKYHEARQEIQAAIPLQTWGDKEIFTQGIDILQKIGGGAPLDEVGENLKKAAVDHFMADFLNCAANPSADKIADLYNDYNNKLVHIENIIENPLLIDSVKSMFNKIRDHYEYCCRQEYDSSINTYTSCYRNAKLAHNLRSNRDHIPDGWVGHIYDDLKFQLLFSAAEHDKERFGKAAADACLQYCTSDISYNPDPSFHFYTDIFLPHRETIAAHLTSEQMSKITQIYENLVSPSTIDNGNSAEVEPQIESNQTGNESTTPELVQTNAAVANTSNQAETPEVEKPKSFVEVVSSSRGNESRGGCSIM